jgi:hypothetical protein
MKRLFWFALLMGVACSSKQASSASESELVAYAQIFSMAQEAEKNCHNTYVSDAAILVLKETSNITEKDDRTLKIELNKSKNALQREIAAEGVDKWCTVILELYGPKGRIQHVLITR